MAAPRRVIIGLAIGWILIVIKSALVPVVFSHWEIPIHSAWVIVPTFIFAIVVTFLVLTHDWRDEDS